MRKRSILPILAVLFVFMSIFSVYSIFHGDKAKEKASVIKQASQTSQTSKKEVLQKKTYPNLNKYSNLEIHVSSTRQTMTITSSDKVIFKTIVSTGAKESPTPKGTFVIEPERGDFFYNASSKEGAYYWVSFKEHGIYLFHSVPTDQQGNEIPEEAKQLGKAASHGCVRMSRADAK
ncbi:TPA: L,D-transpeptidase [Streptococcus agalactiae]